MEKFIKSRRDFLKQTAVLVAGAMVARPLSVFAIGGDSMAPSYYPSFLPSGGSTYVSYYDSYSSNFVPPGASLYAPDSEYNLSDCATELSPSMFAGLPPALRRRMRNALARDPEALCEWLLDNLP